MAQIVLDPVVVALRSGTVDVIAEAILAKDGGEGSSPGDVVRLVEVEDDRHAVEDVDPMDNRRGGWFGLDAERVRELRLGVGVVVGGQRGGGRGAHGGAGG